MNDQFTYEDFDLMIEPGPQGQYRARVVRSPAGESASVQFTVPFSPVELENFVLKVGRRRRGTRGPGRPESAPLKDFGGKLYSAVFQDELRDTLLRSLSQTRAQGIGLRLRLRLTDVPELADLPWEFLYDSRLNRFLAQSRRTPLVRYLDLPEPPQPLSIEGPLRLLVMISSPSDWPPLDVEQEWGLLTEALARPQEEGRVIIERLAANMSTLRRRLRRDEFHVFHFVGHGQYRPDWRDGVLVMEDRLGRSLEVTGEELGGLLNEYDSTRLAVLNACEGARSDANDPFAGMAQSLIQQGLPAVVAMQFEISDDAAIIFAQELYSAIADGYPVEAALAEARQAIRDEGNPTEWGTPVLYSRASDGHLFDVTDRSRISEAYRKAEGEERVRVPLAASEQSGTWGDLLGRVPVVGKVRAGAHPGVTEEDNEYLSVPARYLRGDKIFAVKVKGDSMSWDGVVDGDYVLVDASVEPEDGEIVLVLAGPEEDEAIVRRIRREGAAVQLNPSNPAYESITLERDAYVTILGKVTGVAGKDRRWKRDIR